MAAKDELGIRGERIAERHLLARGWRLLDRNWRCPSGEIDLILQDGDETVFVEVKTRSSTAFGHPFEAISRTKLTRLRRLAGIWADAHPGSGRIRIDIVAVVAPHRAPATVEHLERVL